jgi:hypothetical protein
MEKYKLKYMTTQTDRYPEAPLEAIRDKHINFLAAENGDPDPADDNTTENDEGADNGFFTDDDNQLQTKEEHEEDAANKPSANEKVTPLEPDTQTTLGDRITVSSENEDLVTGFTDDNPDSFNEDDEAH